jgi:hypothetical protein
MSTQILYNINDVRNIISQGYNFVLPQDIIKHIHKIENELGVNNIVQKNYDNKTNSSVFSMPRVKKNEKDDLSWENVRNFKTTKIEQKTGVEKSINDVRIAINKISLKNYDTQRDIILELIKECEQEYPNELRTIGNAIFEIASTNKFFSEIYAKLYGELVHMYPVFKNIMDEFLDKYIQSLQEINYADPNIDYDLFCLYTKQSDKRKAIAQFISHMTKEKIVSHEYVICVIDQLVQNVKDNMEMEGRVNEVEEITELVNIFISLCVTFIDVTEKWKTCMTWIETFSKYKLKDKPSLSSRIIFKYTDLVTIINKKI